MAENAKRRKMFKTYFCANSFCCLLVLFFYEPHTSPHLYLLRACECVYYHKDFEHRLTHTYTQGRRDGCIFKQHMRYFHFRPTCVCVCV